MSTKFVPGPGDWTCSDSKCGNINFSKRDKCNKCGMAKPFENSGHNAKTPAVIGKQAAEKSKGLFSEDDWQCKSCGNINWSRRSTCNVCNMNKVNTQGVRTGYGGGFMERDEVVEYKHRADSDNEYDEFGRKKKQYRSHETGPTTKNEQMDSRSPPPAVQHKASTLSDDEEEEDEGNDEDLSKYDIWGSDGEEDKIDKAAVESGSSSSSSDDSSSSSGGEGSRSSSRRSSTSGHNSNKRKQSRSRSRSPIRDRRQ